VYLDTNTPPTSKEASNQSETSFDPGSLSYDETYYWKIVSWDEHGAKQIGSVWSFTTIAASDEEAPSISNNGVTFSDPIDTSIGWENITCDVIDNVAVDSVWLNISYPDGSSDNLSMTESGAGSFFYNLSLSSVGTYDYFIYALDTNANSEVTETDSFSMYANWDMNNDGVCDNLDLVSISNAYGSSGEPGWIREDIDNNGFIQVLDLSIASAHYGDSYET
jgi:hypothetical protein